MHRRRFFADVRNLLSGTAAATYAAEASSSPGESVVEPSRRIPVIRNTDVLVCGGGPSGFAAAITAARSGARTLILERHPFLGGVWTAGALTIILDAHGKGGLNDEITARLFQGGHALYWKKFPTWAVYGLEGMKYLLDDMASEARIDVQLYTHVAAVQRQDGRIAGVFTESKSGREFVEARVVIDATGDGDVAAFAGCACEKGRPSDGKMQPMTLYGRIGGYHGGPIHIQPLLEICRRGGWNPSYEQITLFPQPNQPGVFMLMATHLYGDGTNVRDLTAAERNGRQEIRKTLAVLKEHGGSDWKDVFLIDTGPFVGIRETRRIQGRYRLTVDDLKAGAKFADAVTTVNFKVDIHYPDPKEGGGLMSFHHPAYQVPYRSLLPIGVDNLIVTGRCISGDHTAFASYRVTGVSVALGEAAGMAAALALAGKTDPAYLDPQLLVSKLAAFRRDLTATWRS